MLHGQLREVRIPAYSVIPVPLNVTTIQFDLLSQKKEQKAYAEGDRMKLVLFTFQFQHLRGNKEKK